MFGNKAKPSRIFTHKARAPLDGADRADEQIWLAHRYANALIEVERNRWDAQQELLRTMFPRIAELEAQIADGEAKLEAARKAIKARNAQARSRTGTTDDRESIKQLQASLKTAREELKTERHRQSGEPKARKAVWQTIERTVNVRHFTESGRKAAMKEIRRQIVDGEPIEGLTADENRVAFGDLELRRERARIDAEALEERKRRRASCGVYWGTYLAVERRVDDAIDDAEHPKPRAGKPPQIPAPPRFQRWDHEGTLAVQLQGGLPWVDAMGGADSRVRIEIEPLAARPRFNKKGKPLPVADPNSRRSREKSRIIVWLRIGTQEDGRSPIWLRAMAHLHRHPPADSVVKWVYLHRNRTGCREWWEAQIVFEREDGWHKDRAVAGECGIDLGWRKVDGGLRVAALCGDDGHGEELILLDADVDRWAKAESLRSIRDREFDATRGRLGEWLRAHDVPDWLREKTAALHAWRACAKLAAVVLHWRTNRFDGDDAMFTAMEEWRKQDRHLYDWETAQTKKAIRWRDKLYRIWAARLRHRYATAKVEKIDWSELQRNPEAESDGKDQAIGLYRIAAVGRLVQLLSEQFRNVGVVDPAWSTKQCHECGQIDDFDAAKELVHTCSACGAVWDQDRNAAVNILRAPIVEMTVVEGKAIPKRERQGVE